MSRDVSPPLLVARTGDLQLESGLILRDVLQAYRRDGPAGSAAVVILHATGGTPADFGGLEPDLVGPGRPLDPSRTTLLAPALLGTGPWSRFAFDGDARLTPRDRARAVGLLLRRLGVRSVSFAVGVGDGLPVARALASAFPSLVALVLDATTRTPGRAGFAPLPAALPPTATTAWASAGATAAAR